MAKKVHVRHFHDGNDGTYAEQHPFVGENGEQVSRLVGERPYAARDGELVDPKFIPEGGYRISGQAPYATRAQLVEDDTGEVLDEEWAFCSPRDVPSRKTGRQVAVGRLLKRHPEMAEEDRLPTS